jgi:hypothetical protein
MTRFLTMTRFSCMSPFSWNSFILLELTQWWSAFQSVVELFLQCHSYVLHTSFALIHQINHNLAFIHIYVIHENSFVESDNISFFVYETSLNFSLHFADGLYNLIRINVLGDVSSEHFIHPKLTSHSVILTQSKGLDLKHVYVKCFSVNHWICKN